MKSRYKYRKYFAVLVFMNASSLMYGSYRFVSPGRAAGYDTEPPAPATSISAATRLDGSLPASYHDHEIDREVVMRSPDRIDTRAAVDTRVVDTSVVARRLQLDPRHESPEALSRKRLRTSPANSPASKISMIAHMFYEKAKAELDMVYARAYEVIRDVSLDIEPRHHNDPLVLRVLHDFNLLLEDGSLDKELMRLYKNLNK